MGIGMGTREWDGMGMKIPFPHTSTFGYYIRLTIIQFLAQVSATFCRLLLLNEWDDAADDNDDDDDNDDASV